MYVTNSVRTAASKGGEGGSFVSSICSKARPFDQGPWVKEALNYQKFRVVGPQALIKQDIKFPPLWSWGSLSTEVPRTETVNTLMITTLTVVQSSEQL
jgi:hypothetical protein